MSPPDRFVVMHADDFGMTGEVNAAILRAYHAGTLRSASLMTAEPAAAEALALAQKTPGLAVGLHLVVTYDRSLLGPQAAPHIVRPDGRFRANPLTAGILYRYSRQAESELRREMDAQFARFADWGLPWSHVDGHQHYHMHPVVWQHLLELCEHYGIYRLRVPTEEFRAHLRGGGQFRAETAGGLVLRMVSAKNRRALQQRAAGGQHPFFFCPRSYGTLQSSNMHVNYVLSLLDRLAPGISEVYFHPGTEYARKLPPQQRREGVQDVELDTLLDPRLLQRLQRGDIRMCSYAEAENAAATLQ